MARAAKLRTSSQSTTRKPAAKASNTKASSYTPRRNKGYFDDEWDDFVEAVKSRVQRSVSLADAAERVPPYDKPASIVKRMTYMFVRRYRRVQPHHIEAAIEHSREYGERKASERDKIHRQPRLRYKEDPYHWVLLGLQSIIHIGDFEVEKDDTTKWSQQLQYAERHDVPSEFLIGFLYQCGTLAEVYEKAKDPSAREDWYKAKQAREAKSKRAAA